MRIPLFRKKEAQDTIWCSLTDFKIGFVSRINGNIVMMNLDDRFPRKPDIRSKITPITIPPPING